MQLGLPQGDGSTAWVTAADGTRTIAAPTSPTPDGHVVLTGAADVQDDHVADVQVRQGAATLLALPTPR